MRSFYGILFSLISIQSFAQGFSADDIRKGYANVSDSTVFLFDEQWYNQKPERVVVTGAFRGWSTDMASKEFQLTKTSDRLWKLSISNPDNKRIPPGCPFKFRINEGKWLDPPSGSLHVEGGNFIYLKGIQPPALKAEIRSNQAIWASVKGVKDRPLKVSDWKLTNAKGELIPIAEVLPNTASETLIKPAVDIDRRRVYYLEIPSLGLKSLCSFDGWFRNLYSNKELGANISEDRTQTSFRVFAPRATGMKLYLYKNQLDKEAYRVIEMKQDADGVWEHIEKGDLKGVWYDLTVHGANDPGNYFFESHPNHISDPYARVVDDSFGKCRVWDRTTPAKPLAKGRPKMQDVISYEVHVQDFTDLLPVDEKLKGTLPAMHMPGLRNQKGQPIGFDYLLNLGINTVHLMPVQEFLNFPDAEWKAAFENDPYMKEQGVNLENYDWGYRTSHSFAIETRFRSKGSEIGSQREQFRDLVQSFHEKGIAVIVDFVFNHTAEDMDGRQYLFAFNALDKQYYYRTKDLQHIGEYGNETKSENRPMVQRWIIDQCKHFMQEFGVDGFRIDLAGQTDKQTLKKLREALGPDAIVYGEPWIASNDPEYEANPDWDWYKADAPITFFQDDARNAFKGPVSNPENKKTDRGFAGGNSSMRDKVKQGLTCTFPDEKSPLSGINYLDIHDNWALADQFATKDWDGRFGVDEDAFKIAAVLLYTSLGPIVTHGGTEMMRSKGLAPLMEVVKESKTGKLYFHGKRDTYNVRNANHFVWENVGRTKSEERIYCDYKGMLAFWQGLNALRLSETGKVFRQEKAVPADYYRFIEPVNSYLLGYVIDNSILVLLNTEEKPNQFNNLNLPSGNWVRIGNNQQINLNKGVGGEFSKLKGGSSLSVSLPAQGLGIWVRR